MTRKSPVGKTTVNVKDLGSLQGVSYEDGICQFYGIPFARLSKRWTRAELATSWENDFHDGTKLGPHYPTPPEKHNVYDVRYPVVELPEIEDWPEDELKCLNLNIAVPPKSAANSAPFPVMVYIHGGAFWFGGNHYPIHDVAALTSHSVKIGLPIIAVSINYRLGIGGFLASKSIKDELASDGFSGVGNFGLTDQQTALDWVQRYIADFHGDPDNVTLFGESAGGISVAHQIMAARPAKFKQAIQMSGPLLPVESWSLERHQAKYNRLCYRFDIDPTALDALEKLRRVSEHDLNVVTVSLEPTNFYVYNPCDDGVFHTTRPSLDYGRAFPSWLEAIMIGDTTDEGELWRRVIEQHNYTFLVDQMEKFMSTSEVEKCLGVYQLTA